MVGIQYHGVGGRGSNSRNLVDSMQTLKWRRHRTNRRLNDLAILNPKPYTTFWILMTEALIVDYGN